MADIASHLAVELRSPEFSEGYSESFLDTYVATQIKVLREQRGMTQKDLGKALQTSQTVISRIEGSGYSSWNIKTLKKLARAFEVRLHISFETVGSVIDEVSTFSRKALQRASRSQDPKLYPATAETASTVIATVAQGNTWDGPQLYVNDTTLPARGRAAWMPPTRDMQRDETGLEQPLEAANGR